MSAASDMHSERTIKLLDIVYDLHGSDRFYPYENLPFSFESDGGVALSPRLMSELSKGENQHLLDWAQENIVKLFEQ